MVKIHDDDVITAARQLVARRGQAARQEATERAAEFARQARWPEHAVAARVLTAVEDLLDEKLS